MKNSFCIALIVCAVHAAAGEAPLKATVTAAASAPVVPETFVVVLTLKQKSSDARAAMDTLESARKTAVEKLKTLGATVAAVDNEPPHLAETEKSGQMARAMRMAQGNNRLKKKKAGEATEVEMQQTINVPFSLTAKDAAGMLLESETIKAAVLGAKLLPEPPEDGENEDDMSSMMMNQFGMKKRGVLDFEFRAPIGAEARRAVYSAAVKSAREKAAALAAAAGLSKAELGSVSVVDQESGDNENPQMAMLRTMMGNAATAVKKDYVSGESPSLKLNASVTAEFLLK